MSAKRDYSEVKWPWDGDPNWDQPREGATYDSTEDENWCLACSECGLHFTDDLVMATVADHWENHFEGEAPQVQLNLVWIGLGVPPKPPVAGGEE